MAMSVFNTRDWTFVYVCMYVRNNHIYTSKNLIYMYVYIHMYVCIYDPSVCMLICVNV